MKATSSELVCDVKGVHYGEWHGDKLWLDNFKEKNHQVYKLRFVTGNTPKTSYFDDEKKEWVWDSLSVIKTKKGVIYYGALAEGGFVSAVLNNDESKIVVNYISSEGEYIKKEFTNSNTEFAECTKL